MDFEKLQQSWKTQYVPERLGKSPMEVISHLKLHQQQLRKSQISTTVRFGLVIGILLFVLFYWGPQRSFLFVASLSALTLLLALYVLIGWLGARKVEQPQHTTIGFLRSCANKLKWQRNTLTVFTNLYVGLFAAAFTLYTLDITQAMEASTQLLSLMGLNLAIYGINRLWWQLKRREEVEEIDQLLLRLYALEDNFKHNP